MTASHHAELQDLRPALLRFAVLQLRNETIAEDVVQDTLMAVLESPDRFAGRSSLRTYVTGILRHKIVDALRAGTREVPLADADSGSGDESGDLPDAVFTADGHTVDMPCHWGDPGAALERKDFFRVLETCVSRLPPKTARIFLMREWLELDTEEICRELGITSSNAWVMLYRARLQLRACLDLNWFAR